MWWTRSTINICTSFTFKWQSVRERQRHFTFWLWKPIAYRVSEVWIRMSFVDLDLRPSALGTYLKFIKCSVISPSTKYGNPIAIHHCVMTSQNVTAEVTCSVSCDVGRWVRNDHGPSGRIAAAESLLPHLCIGTACQLDVSSCKQMLRQ